MNPDQAKWLRENAPDIHFLADGATGGWLIRCELAGAWGTRIVEIGEGHFPDWAKIIQILQYELEIIQQLDISKQT